MTNEIIYLYEKLPELLIPWYRKNARDLPWRKDKDPYHVWISEIMLQQTRVEAVKGYYIRFLQRLPDIRSLAEVSENELLKLWEGLGYYNRARNLQKAAQKILLEHEGVFPSEYSKIRALPGIGEYTAGAVASNCFDEPIPAVDGNVLRVITRITENRNDISKTATRRQIAGNLERIYPRENCGDFTQSLMELGATVCLPNGKPKCEECPVSLICLAYQKGIQEELPVKAKKPLRKTEEKTVFLLQCGDRIAVKQREEKGLLSGLWEFPNVEGTLNPQQAIKQVENWGTEPAGICREVRENHIFTHVQWEMTGYTIVCQRKNETFLWVTAEELQKEIPLPSAFKKFGLFC